MESMSVLMKWKRVRFSLWDMKKSSLLDPDGTETVQVPVDRYLLASYDQNGAEGYILSAGDYYFAVGESSHDALNNILAGAGICRNV